MKQSLIKIVYGILDFIFPEWFAEKIKMTGCIWTGDWHLNPPYPLFPPETFKDVTDEKISIAYSGFPENEISCIKTYVNRQNGLDSVYPRDGILYKYSQILGELSEEYYRIKKAVHKESKKIRFIHAKGCEKTTECLYFHHGLRFAPQEVKEYIKGKIFIDAGAGFGDSSLIFCKYYDPLKVCSFEPSEINRKHYLTFMKRNSVNENRYELLPVGLGEKNSVVYFADNGGMAVSLLSDNEDAKSTVEIQSVDQFFLSRSGKIGLIKADVEGMCLPLLKGATKIIKRDLPVLSLCIYHNKEELLDVYPYLKSLALDYEVHVQAHSSSAETAELTMMAFPRHLLS